jgi:hypothetical protein
VAHRWGSYSRASPTWDTPLRFLHRQRRINLIAGGRTVSDDSRASGPDHVLAADWISLGDLHCFLWLTSFYVAYSFDDSDWLAIQAGLETLQTEADVFSYPIDGRPALEISLGKNPGVDEVTFTITAQPGQQDQSHQALAIRIGTIVETLYHASRPW